MEIFGTFLGILGIIFAFEMPRKKFISLFYSNSNKSNVKHKIRNVDKTISQELLLKFTTFEYRKKHLSSYENSIDLLENVSEYAYTYNLISVSVAIQIQNKIIELHKCDKHDIKLIFPANIIETKYFDKLITKEINIIDFINYINKTNLEKNDFDKLAISWKKYLDRYAFDWKYITPKETNEASKELIKKSLLWIYGNTCTGKTYFALHLFKNNFNNVVYNSAFSNSTPIELVKILLQYGYNYSIILDDLQTNYEISTKLIKIINENINLYKYRKSKVILISWTDLYKKLQSINQIKAININSEQFVFRLSHLQIQTSQTANFSS